MLPSSVAPGVAPSSPHVVDEEFALALRAAGVAPEDMARLAHPGPATSLPSIAGSGAAPVSATH